MTTRAELHSLIRRRLGDLRAPVEFSDLQINQWIVDAIAEYSLAFPRLLEGSIPAVDGVHAYSLAAYPEMHAILRVEYPYGCQPPVYLERRKENDSRGFYGANLYDLKALPSGGTHLLIGAQPQSGSTIAVTYSADHDYPDADGDVLSVPDRHLELLVLFVRLAAYQEQLAVVSADDSASAYLLANLSLNVNRVEKEYKARLQEYQRASAPGSEVVAWAMEIS